MAPKRSWLQIAPDSHFSLSNIPFGIITTASDPRPRIATAIGDYAFDLFAFFFVDDYTSLSSKLDEDASITRSHCDIFSSSNLNGFAALGQSVTKAVRRHVQALFIEDTPYPDLLKKNGTLQKKVLIPLTEVTMHLPFVIGDYTDFYVGLHHAMNCGVLLRGPGQELQPNYKHLPVGYHGRASSVVVSGTPITRPSGQILPSPGSNPIFSACKKLDFELELGCFIGKANKMGTPVKIGEAAEYLFGVVLMNDWSARDIQTWEMVPLGPFNAKNFGTSVSPWVITMDALEPFLVNGLESERQLLDYLKSDTEGKVADINLQVALQVPNGQTQTITKTTSKNLIFSFPQMLTHHAVGGCPFNPGDLLGSGTISGADRGSFGSFFEQSEGGKSTITVCGETRTFLEDGDTVIFTGVCGKEEYGLVGFGQCSGTIKSAYKFD